MLFLQNEEILFATASRASYCFAESTVSRFQRWLKVAGISVTIVNKWKKFLHAYNNYKNSNKNDYLFKFYIVK